MQPCCREMSGLSDAEFRFQILGMDRYNNKLFTHNIYINKTELGSTFEHLEVS